MRIVLRCGDVLAESGDLFLVATHSTVPDKEGPGTALGNVGQLALRRYGDEFESVVGQVDPFPLGQAWLEPAEDVELPWRWVGLLGTLHVTTTEDASARAEGWLLASLDAALREASQRGLTTVVSPLQRGGWRMNWRTALGLMVQAADGVHDAGMTLVLMERSPERFREMAELATAYALEVESDGREA